jgi:hypothetical protein
MLGYAVNEHDGNMSSAHGRQEERQCDLKKFQFPQKTI